MKWAKFLLVATAALLLASGCGNDKTKADLRNSAAGKPSQEMSIKAKEKLTTYEEISKIHAVNSKKRLFVAFDVHHNSKFTIEDIEERAHKDLKKMFPKKQIEISTDSKLTKETEELESRLQKRKGKVDIDKQLDRLTKLANKKT